MRKKEVELEIDGRIQVTVDMIYDPSGSGIVSFFSRTGEVRRDLVGVEGVTSLKRRVHQTTKG